LEITPEYVWPTGGTFTLFSGGTLFESQLMPFITCMVFLVFLDLFEASAVIGPSHFFSFHSMTVEAVR
jgi:hypothetical protein